MRGSDFNAYTPRGLIAFLAVVFGYGLVCAAIGWLAAGLMGVEL